jgi:hypothetical protein
MMLLDSGGSVRTIHTFVLRLLVDTNESDALRGSLHSVSTNKEEPFADAQALLDLLRQMIGRPSKMRYTENEGDGEQLQITQPEDQIGH